MNVDLRPSDWGSQALAWVRSLDGDQLKAIVMALGPETPAGAAWARLVYSAKLPSEEERQEEVLKTEGKALLTDLLGWLNK